MKQFYINGSACLWEKISSPDGQTVLPIQELDYKEWITPNQLRRMNRLTRMALSAGLMAMEKAGITAVDAIVTATGYGCMESTYQFIERLFNQQGLPMNPSAFIQSTHNTPGSQLALHLKNHGYNNTITANECAFELALDDALAHASESDARQLLVGAFDEVTQPLLDILRPLSLPDDFEPVTEGSAFFVLSQQKQPTSIAIKHFAVGTQQNLLALLPHLLQEYAIRRVCVNNATRKRGAVAAGKRYDYEVFSYHSPTDSAHICHRICEELKKPAESGCSQNKALLSITRTGMASLLILGNA